MKVRVSVGTSHIAGQGHFAAQDIWKGTAIIQYLGEKISKAESHTRLAQGNAYIFEPNERYDIDGKVLSNTALHEPFLRSELYRRKDNSHHLDYRPPQHQSRREIELQIRV